MKKIIFSIVVVLLLISLSNVPLIKWFIGSNDCQFSNNDGSFTFAEINFKGANFQLCTEDFLEFKKRRLGDTVLYRLCPMSITHFWDYGEYIFSQKYKIPYKAWQEIESRRGPLRNKSGFQDF
ncbi:MAG TPA: hypothetical protein VGN00_12850 [Puia sp.]|jgi:hypothetical protein